MSLIIVALIIITSLDNYSISCYQRAVLNGGAPLFIFALSLAIFCHDLGREPKNKN